MFFEVYSKYPQNVNIQFEIKDNQEKVVYQNTLDKFLDSGRTQIIDTIKIDTTKDASIGLGKYILNVTVFNSTKESKVSTDKIFLSRWVGVPFVINDLDKAISELTYIATPSELGYIKDTSDQKEKIKRYLNFWKKKDPTPNTEENEIFNEYSADGGQVIEQLVQGDLSELLLESVHWLARRQNADGGWGDCEGAESNIAATMLVQAAFRLTGIPAKYSDLMVRADQFVVGQGGLAGLRRINGNDKAFIAPVLANCACGYEYVATSADVIVRMGKPAEALAR